MEPEKPKPRWVAVFVFWLVVTVATRWATSQTVEILKWVIP